MHTPFRALAPSFSALIFALALSACLPAIHPGSTRLMACTVPVFDRTAPASGSDLRPYLSEAAGFTGVRFRWVDSPEEARYGLLIERIPAGTPETIRGSYAETFQSKGARGEHIVVGSVIRLRTNTSAGIRRHEIGHLFNLAHNPSSPVMQSAPDPNATWSSAERSSMRALAVRSGCR